MRMGAGLSRAQQGSMLIELAVALVIATLLAAWGAHTLVNRYRDAQAQAAAVWMESLHKAVVAYVRRHGPDIQTAVDVQALVLPGFADWQAPSLGELAEAGLLSSAIPHSTPLTGSAQIAVWRSGDCPGNVCAVEALINAERALLDADGSETDQAMVAQWLLAAQGKGAAVQPARPDRIQGGALDLDNRLPGGRVLPVGTVGMAVTAEHLALWSYLRVRDPRNPEFQGQMSVEGNIAGGADARFSGQLVVGATHDRGEPCDAENAIAHAREGGLLVCRENLWRSAGGAGAGGYGYHSLRGCRTANGESTANPVTGSCSCPLYAVEALIMEVGENDFPDGKQYAYLCVG